MKTRLLYWENTYLFESVAQIIAIEKDEERGAYVVLDSTIFYPQGGGQPSDIGEIKSDSGSLEVHAVRMVDEYVRHYVEGNLMSFKVGQSVSLAVDEAARLNHARLHTAGHVLAIAASHLFPEWRAVKGHHFPDGCYVEFEGSLGVEGDVAVDMLDRQLVEEIERNWPIKAKVFTENGTREVSIGHYPPVPCGGTHVAWAVELRAVSVRKVKEKRGRIKVSYGMGGE